MSVEAEAAELLVRLTMDGTEKMLRFTGSMAQMSGKLFIYLCAVLSNNRARDIAMNPGGMCTVTIPKDKVRDFARTARKYNLQYFVAKDPYHEKGLEDICIRAEDAVVASRIIEKLDILAVASSSVERMQDFESFEQAAKAKQDPTVTFDRALNRLTEKDFSKETPRYICERGNPSHYIELLSSRESFHGEAYTKTTYTVYQNDEKMGIYHDGGFEGRPRRYWEEIKGQMKEAGGFSDDMTFFDEKEDFDHYRHLYAARNEKAPTAEELKASLQREVDAYALQKGEENPNPAGALEAVKQEGLSGHGAKTGKPSGKAGSETGIRGFVEKYKKEKAADLPVPALGKGQARGRGMDG